jgi:Zn-dependent alcohol dehydrogenase
MKLREHTHEFWGMKLPGNKQYYVYAALLYNIITFLIDRVSWWIDICRIVESVGEGVRDMEAGDHVVPIFNGECGDCVYCKCEKTNMCERSGVNPFKTVMVSDGKSRFSSKEGNPIFHFLNTSTFSEYTVLESACVVKIDPHASLKKMTLLSCGVSTGK